MTSPRTSIDLFLGLGALAGLLGSGIPMATPAMANPAPYQQGIPEGGEGGEEGEGGEGGEAGEGSKDGQAGPQQQPQGVHGGQQHSFSDFEGGEGGERGALKGHPFYIKAKNEVEFEGTEYEENITEMRLGYEAMLGERTYFHLEAGPGYAANEDGEGGYVTGTEAKLVQHIGKKADAELKYVGRYGHASQLFTNEFEVELKYRF